MAFGYDEAVRMADRSRERIAAHTQKAEEMDAEDGNRSREIAAIMRDCAAVASIALMRAEQRIALGRQPEDEPQIPSPPARPETIRPARSAQPSSVPAPPSPMRGMRRGQGR